MYSLKVVIHNIKGIQHGVFETTLGNDLYALVGNNGSGKSSIMLCMSQLVGKHNLSILRKEDFSNDSYVEFTIDNKVTSWFYNLSNKRWEAKEFPNILTINGTYEGSLFYGNRFQDSRIIDDLLESGQIQSNEIVDADAYVQEKLGEILHNNQDYYTGLKRIRNRHIAKKLKVTNTPYFLQVNDSLISQYRMSSGECLLISLLHFIYNSLERKSLSRDKPILILIDEIELALHPIAVTRFIKYINDLLEKYNNLTVFVTSHAPEVIRMINPSNMFKLERMKENKDNEFNFVNPCYPSYVIRDVYKHSGFDILLLVEDKLAQMLVENLINKFELNKSRLINVVPVGGWNNVLSLHKDLVSTNTIGLNTNIISILDGDVQPEVSKNKDYQNLPKTFLPIESLEKYLHKNLIRNNDLDLKKILQDKLFKVMSLDDLIQNYKRGLRDEISAYRKRMQEKGNPIPSPLPMEEAIVKYDSDGKKFYAKIKSELALNSISEEIIIQRIFEIINHKVDLSKFTDSLRELLLNPYK